MKHWPSIIPILGLTVLFLGVAIVFADQWQAFGDFLVNRFGLTGLLIGTFVMDYILQPFPPDIPLYSYILSGGSLWWTAWWVGVASVLGAVAGYWTGRLLQYEGAIRFIGERKYNRAHRLFEKHGRLAVMVAALTPVPFNVVAWSAGVFQMSFVPFVVTAALARIPRFFAVAVLALWVS